MWAVYGIGLIFKPILLTQIGATMHLSVNRIIDWILRKGFKIDLGFPKEAETAARSWVKSAEDNPRRRLWQIAGAAWLTLGLILFGLLLVTV